MCHGAGGRGGQEARVLGVVLSRLCSVSLGESPASLSLRFLMNNTLLMDIL